MIVRELLTRLGFTVDEAGAKKYETAYRRAANNVGAAMGRVQAAFGGIGAQLAATLGVGAIVNMAREWQDLEAVLKQTGVAAGKTLHTLDQLTTAANAAGQSTQTLADTYMSLIRSGIDPEPALEMATALGSIAGSSQGAAGAIRQLGQSLAKGRLLMEEFNILSENSPVLASKLQEALGYKGKQAEFFKAMSDGLLTTDKLITALRGLEQIEPPDTLTTAITRLNNNLRQAAGGSDEASTALRAMTKVVNWLSENIGVLTGLMAALIAGSAIGFLAWVAQATVALGSLAMAFGGLALAILANPITWIIAGLAALALVIQDVYKWITGGESVIGEWLGPWEEVVTKAKATWQGFLDWLNSSWDAFRAAGAAAIDAATSAIYEAIRGAIEDPWGTLWNATLPGMLGAAVPGLFDPLRDAFNDVLDWMSGAWNALISGLKGLIPDWLRRAAEWAMGGGGDGGGSTAPAPQPALDGARASGGPVKRGGSYWVGEEGPEPFIPKQSGWVLPAGFSGLLGRLGEMRTPAPSGGQLTANVSLDVNVQGAPGQPEAETRRQGQIVGAEVRRAIQDELRAAIEATLPSFPETA